MVNGAISGVSDYSVTGAAQSRLTTGLKARRPEDVEFVERVAEMVRAGQLPAKVVDSTFLWAIRRGRSYPFPAFQRALRIQADRLGITID